MAMEAQQERCFPVHQPPAPQPRAQTELPRYPQWQCQEIDAIGPAQMHDQLPQPSLVQKVCSPSPRRMPDRHTSARRTLAYDSPSHSPTELPIAHPPNNLHHALACPSDCSPIYPSIYPPTHMSAHPFVHAWSLGRIAACPCKPVRPLI